MGLGQVSSRWHLGPIHTAPELLLDGHQHCRRQESGKGFPGPWGPFLSPESLSSLGWAERWQREGLWIGPGVTG